MDEACFAGLPHVTGAAGWHAACKNRATGHAPDFQLQERAMSSRLLAYRPEMEMPMPAAVLPLQHEDELEE